MPDLEWVDSTSIEAVGYVEEERALIIQFVGGRQYRYEGVPPEVHHELIQADSKGSYFNREIKPNYPFTPL
jgi:hypothetical protein